MASLHCHIHCHVLCINFDFILIFKLWTPLETSLHVLRYDFNGLSFDYLLIHL